MLARLCRDTDKKNSTAQYEYMWSNDKSQLYSNLDFSRESDVCAAETELLRRIFTFLYDIFFFCYCPLSVYLARVQFISFTCHDC